MGEKKNIEKICPHCGKAFHYQMHRSRMMKIVSVLFPVKRFFCSRCRRACYVFVSRDEKDNTF